MIKYKEETKGKKRALYWMMQFGMKNQETFNFNSSIQLHNIVNLILKATGTVMITEII
eukprot:m.112904 g.112904  ORF g.112904 m.112904 type:complete len:58 (+) comp9258_c5_seq1:2472-2645(+)